MPETGTEIVSRETGALSAQQAAFVEARLRGSSVEDAMEMAGYAPGDWLRVISDPAIISEIDKGIKALFAHEALEAANMLKLSIKNLSSADRVKLDAARLVLGIAGHVAPTRVPVERRHANLADMGADDIRALVDQLQGELAGRATPVNAPNGTPEARKPADFLD